VLAVVLAAAAVEPVEDLPNDTELVWARLPWCAEYRLSDSPAYLGVPYYGEPEAVYRVDVAYVAGED